MNDIEDLVRQELRARVAAAEAAAPEEQPVAMLADLDRRIRRARLNRRWTASVLSAVAVLAAVTLPLTLASSGQPPPQLGSPAAQASVPLTDTAATPRGWAPVAYGDAQISVPADWRVATTPVCGRAAPGYVVLGNMSTNLIVQNPRCRQAPNTAAILLGAPGKGRGALAGATKINGIPVESVLLAPSEDGSVSYFVPGLHVMVTAHGSLARRVLATLTRSPLSVALAAGTRFPVPHSWRWHDFGGIRFATPARWRTEKSSVWYPCWWTIESTQAVKLVKATRNERFMCPPSPFIVGFMRPRHGLVVGAGRFASPYDDAGAECMSLNGLRACFDSPSPGRPLEVVVHTPSQHKPTVVYVGLKGNGVEARTIVESIRPG
jgi:hypothetical protein